MAHVDKPASAQLIDQKFVINGIRHRFSLRVGLTIIIYYYAYNMHIIMHACILHPIVHILPNKDSISFGTT